MLQAVRNIAKPFMHPFQKSLRYRLMLLMVAIAVMPLAMVTIFAAKTTKQTLSTEVIRSNESRMEWAAKYFDEKFDQLQAVSYTLLLDHNLFPVHSGEKRGDGGPDASDTYITEKLRALYFANNRNIAQIALYFKSKQRLFIVDKDAVRSSDQLRTPNVNWDELARAGQSVNRIVSGAGGGSGKFTLVRSMNRFEDRAVLGGVSIDVRWSMMESVLDMVHSEANGEVFLLDGQGRMVYNPYSRAVTPDRSLLAQIAASPDEPGYMQLKEGFLFYQPTVSGQLWIVKFIPIGYVTNGAASTLQFSFYTAVLFIALAIAVSVLTAYFTTKPIIRLTRSMKAVEIQNFDVGVSTLRSDEIGTLERRFNSMLSRIKELIQTEYKSKIEKRTAQLKAMQAQINPHFLYNALQSIGGIALSRNVPEIYEHVRAISELFRYTVRMKSDLVTVSDELEHVGNYLRIQKLRFQHTLRYRIDTDSDCLSCHLPKFSLQPIVENCFVHGLEKQPGEWSIRIRVQKVLDEIEISVEDNGAGIGEARLEEIRRRLSRQQEEEREGNGLGIGNVDSRLKLMFGEDYGIYISSREGAGTTVSMIVPAIESQIGEREQ